MKLVILVSLVFLTSCTAQKVSIFIEVHKPYCGGAKPTPDMAKGSSVPFSNEKVAVYKVRGDLSSFYKWIQMDSDGKWNGSLKSGNYKIYRTDKTLSIEEIQKKFRKPDSEMYAFVGEEMVKSWKETPDLTFEVKDQASVSITLREKCFVGLNPCMEYVGPKPK